jgi:gluconate kinase
MNFYALPENRTEAQINSDAAGKEFFKQIKNTDKFKVAHATALAKMQEEKKSKIEQKFLEAVQEIHPDAIGSYVLDFYTFDVFIPSTMELFEVNGNYWHNMPDTRARDIRKTRFIKSNRPEYKLYSVWENELNDIESKHMLAHARQDVGVLILSGPSGCGKSYVGDLLKDRFNIIDYDTLGYDGCIAAARLNIGVKNIIITSFQGKRMSTELRLAGIRNHCVYLREESSVIKDRIMSRGSCLDSLDKRVARYESLKDKIFQYYGTQQDIIEWFISL